MRGDEGPEEDPNEQYVQSLSDSEQEAYCVALYGEMTYDEEFDYEFGGGIEYGDGCYDQAYEQVYAEDSMISVWEDPQFEDLVLAMEEMYSGNIDSPEMAALDAEWSACMGRAGYSDMKVRTDAQDMVYDQLFELYALESDDTETDGFEIP